MRVGTRLVSCVILTLLLAAPATLHAQESLTKARDLYATAAYEDALQVLDALGVVDGPARSEIAVVRALCLFALNRGSAAEHAIEAMVVNDPLYRPPVDDIPPRMRATITAVRRRVLPTLVQTMYSNAKAAFDRKEFPVATEGFKKVMQALKDEDLATAEGQPVLSDIRTLAGGFLDLSVAATPPPPPPAPEPVVEAPRPDPQRVYTADDLNVVPPRIVRQEVPLYRGPVRTPRAGVIEVVINEAGTVDSAVMRLGVDATFDRRALDATKSWRYQPATLNGAAVKFVKRIQVNIVPSS